ncbi:flavocytochrome c [Malonomonas rubra DSM 5091]|uniref:Flavocytochrome c n=2 Tax=Malonomonas rubra TaxID=57040 RepID=A0A1M6MP70_MALRU|nr:flavocytochrome c [Malonomonas rubra DSM 5091]
MIWDEEYDVVVVGSGFAGLAAAIEAKQAGASVIVLEKMRIPGGNSAISGGLVAVAGSPLQQREGIEDSPELLFADMLTAGMDLNHPELARLVAEQSPEILQWTQAFLGVKYSENLNYLGGHSVARTYVTANGTGSGIIQPMLAKCRELEIPVQMKTLLCALLKDENGRVEGVELCCDYLFPNKDSGRLQRVRARRGVVLACGGFGRDVEFRMTQDPRLNEKIETTNQLGATADALVVALQAGATPVHLSWIQMGPWASSDEKGWGVGSMFTMLAGFPYGIMVDAKTGKRFVNEGSDRRLRTDAMLTKDRIPVAIVDSEGVKNATTLENCLKRGVVKAFDSIEGLADFNQIPLTALKETLERYHLSLEHGRDAEFGKPLAADLKPIEHPPFYSIRLLPKVHHCMGGVQINSRAQVIGIADHQPIAGLYAAGEITGGVHGASRLGSTAIVDCLVFGRIAGRSAAADS